MKEESLKEELTEIDKSIIKLLKDSDKPMTTYHVAKGSDVSWSTANSHCYKLRSMGLVDCSLHESKSGIGRKMVWWATK